MDIFQFAMEKEKLSEDYYRQLSRKTGNKGLKSILTMLADEEHKHLQVVQQMQHQAPKTITDTNVLGEAKVVFERMRDSAATFRFDVSELRVYEKARENEKKSRQFYLEKADEVSDPSHKEVFQKLANEEQKHFILLDALCDFVGRPQTFLENAEMTHLEGYAEGVF